MEGTYRVTRCEHMPTDRWMKQHISLEESMNPMNANTAATALYTRSIPTAGPHCVKDFLLDLAGVSPTVSFVTPRDAARLVQSIFGIHEDDLAMLENGFRVASQFPGTLALANEFLGLMLHDIANRQDLDYTAWAATMSHLTERYGQVQPHLDVDLDGIPNVVEEQMEVVTNA